MNLIERRSGQGQKENKRFLRDLSYNTECGGGTAATAVACKATSRGFESHPPLHGEPSVSPHLSFYFVKFINSSA